MADDVGIFEAHRGFAAKQTADFHLVISGSPGKFSLVHPMFGGDAPQDGAHSCGKGLHDCKGYADCNLPPIVSDYVSDMQRCISTGWWIEGIDMTDTATRSHAQAIAKLREARGDLLCARLAALDAQLWLVGAHVSNGGGEQCSDRRVKRAAELCELVGDAVAHADRLLFFIEGDSQW
jgi:hypothetical protein